MRMEEAPGLGLDGTGVESTLITGIRAWAFSGNFSTVGRTLGPDANGESVEKVLALVPGIVPVKEGMCAAGREDYTEESTEAGRQLSQ